MTAARPESLPKRRFGDGPPVSLFTLGTMRALESPSQLQAVLEVQVQLVVKEHKVVREVKEVLVVSEDKALKAVQEELVVRAVKDHKDHKDHKVGQEELEELELKGQLVPRVQQVHKVPQELHPTGQQMPR